MKGVSLSFPGLEDICVQEVKEILKTESKKISSGVVLFSAKKEEDVAKFCFLSRSSFRVFLYLGSFHFSLEEDIFKNLKKITIPKNFTRSFKVECLRKGTHDFTSQDVEKTLGEIIRGKYSYAVDLYNPSFIVYMYIMNDFCVYGIDFSGFPLHKRHYKVKPSSRDINSCLAYSLIRISGWNAKKRFLDPFCGNGTILIEAALYGTNKEINPLEKYFFCRFIHKKFSLKERKIPKLFGLDPLFFHIRDTRINSKVAGVFNFLKIQVGELSWLDTLFDKGKIDTLVTIFPKFTERNKEDIHKITKEFFHHAHFILSKKGKITLLSNTENIVDFLEYFTLFEKRKILIGDSDYFIFTFDHATRTRPHQ